MSEYPWWFIPAVGAAVAAFIRFMVGVYRLAFGDSIVKGGYSDDIRAKEDEAIAKRFAFYTKESARLQIESAKYKAMLEPEIQCEGCGNFHNLIRCPTCRRMNNAHSMVIKHAAKVVGYVDDVSSWEPPRPVSWVAGGSANVADAVNNVRERSFMDVSSEAIRALRAHAFLDLTPHKSQGE